MTNFSQNHSTLVLALANVRRCATPVPAERLTRKFGPGAVLTLIHMGLIKNSTSIPNCVVTVKHKRDIIDQLTNKVDNRNLDLSPARPITPALPAIEFHQNKNPQTMVLAYIFRAPHAVHVDAIKYMLTEKGLTGLSAEQALDDLLRLGLIQKHERNANCYFTRRNKRDAIMAMTSKVKRDAFPTTATPSAPVVPPARDLYYGRASHLDRR